MYKLTKYNITQNVKKTNKKNNVLQHSNYLKNEFIKKNKILANSYTQIQPFYFLEKYFKKIYVLKENFGRIEYINTDDLGKHFLYNDIYIYYNNYKNYPKDKLLIDINFLIVDIDYISSEDLKHFIKYTLQKIRCKPNYILNSGSGLHLIYKIENINLQQNYTKYYNYKQFINNVNLALQQRFVHKKLNYKVDIHSITQPYRLPGSTTKFGQQSVLFQVSDTAYNINTLAKWLCVALPTPIKNNIKNENKIKKANNNILHIPRGKKQFYYWLLSKKADVVVGKRYMYMFSLAIAAYKAKVNINILKNDLNNVVAYFNKNSNNKIKDNEIDKALKGYCNKATLVKWETMSKWTGIQSEVKRNFRSREEHLYLLRKLQEGRKELNEIKIKKLIAEGYNKTEIAKKLKISRRNLYKTYKHLF
jgi:hypothetical protein